MIELNVLIVCGSPRQGNSEAVSKKLTELLKEEGASVDLVLLREKNIQPWHEGHESASDDMPPLIEKFEKANAFIIVSPTYYGMPPGILKNFIDRTDVFFGKREEFSHKVASIVSIGATPLGGGIELNANCLRTFFQMLGVKVIDCLYLKGEAELREKNQILKTKTVKEKLPTLAKNLVHSMKCFIG